MTHEILTTEAMDRADRFAMESGVSGETMMEAAGRACAQAVMQRWAARRTAVLCGPGNNGGDGWVIARHLAETGWPVTMFSMTGREALKGDAAVMAGRWTGAAEPLEAFKAGGFGLVVDALFGAGLSRPLEGAAARAAQACSGAGGPLVAAVDLPSGVHGDRARADGPAFAADLTATFHRLKPAHVLWPGRGACGEIVLADIGVPEGWEQATEPLAALNTPDLWPNLPAEASGDTHKHRRGRVSVLAGGAGATGAARLSANAALTGGAGFVTLLCPGGSLLEAASASLAVVTKKLDREQDFGAALTDAKAQAAVLGPGAGLNDATRERVLSALKTDIPLVLDADALTAFADQPDILFGALRETCVLTPHAGEFERLFPRLLEDSENKIKAAGAAAARCGAVMALKGPDTVIAAPDGRVRVNVHAGPALATAGTGDVLTGLIATLLAQGADPFDAASAGVWLHGDAGLSMGIGRTAEDLPGRIAGALQRLADRRAHNVALRQLSARERR